MNHDHTVSGMRIMRHALGPHIERGRHEIQRAHQRRQTKNRNARDPQIGAQSFTRPGRWHRAQRRISRPPMQRSASRHKKRRDDHHESHKRRPERKHVQDRKRHIRRADLNGQKVISESSLRRRGQHEEHHDGAVHGEQAEIGFRLDLAHQRQHRGRPDQMNAHQQRQEHPHKHCRERQKEILNADNFVIEAENIFPNESLRSVRVSRSRGRHFIVSPPPVPPATCRNLPG